MNDIPQNKRYSNHKDIIISQGCKYYQHVRCKVEDCSCYCHNDIFRFTRHELKTMIEYVLSRSKPKRVRNHHLICSTLKVTGARVMDPYHYGLKRCTTCNVYYDFDNNYCLCCGLKLRLSKKSKTHFRVIPECIIPKQDILLSKTETKDKDNIIISSSVIKQLDDQSNRIIDLIESIE